VNLGLGAVTGVLAARLLGPVGRGELAALTIWPTALVTLAAMGMNQAIVFHTGRRSFTFSEVWTGSTIIGLAQSSFVLVVGLVLIPIALRRYPPQVATLSLASLGACPLIILSAYLANLLQGKMELLSYNLIMTAAPLAYALGLALLAVLHWPYLGALVAVRILGYVFAFALSYWLLLNREGVRWAWNGRACSSLLRFGWKTQLGTVSALVNRWLDQLVLSIFVPPRDLGLYAVAVTVAFAVCFVPQAAGIVTLAAGSNASPEGARAVIARAYKLSLLWLLLVCALLYVFVPFLMTHVFGAQFAGAVLACRILLPGMVAVGLTQVLYEGARALGDPAIPSYAEGFATIVTLASLYVLLPRVGFVGAAIASSLAYGSSHGLTLALYSSRLGIGLNDLLTGFFKAEDLSSVGREFVSRLRYRA
jgi:O-antigen/teichoic acid export membrane protein